MFLDGVRLVPRRCQEAVLKMIGKCLEAVENKSEVDSVQYGRIFKIANFVLQKAATPKNEAEFHCCH